MRRTSIAALVIVLTLAACGGSKSPTTPVVVVSPSPSPSPVVLGQGIGCGLPVMPECGQVEGPPEGSPPGVFGCCTKEAGGGYFVDWVGESITKAQREQPQLFNGNLVLDRVAYQLAVARILERDYKVCAKPGGPGDEVAVKDNNGDSEQYDIYQSNARVFNPPGYQVTCRPARF